MSNILVIRDKAHPENEGKVFLFKYGIKIFERLEWLTEPQFDDKKPINPFNLYTGVNFRIRVKKNAGGFFSYDDSESNSPSQSRRPMKKLNQFGNHAIPLRNFSMRRTLNRMVNSNNV